MKKIFLFTLLLILGAITSAQANGRVPLRTVKNAQTAAVRAATVHPRPLPPIPGSFVHPAFVVTNKAAVTAVKAAGNVTAHTAPTASTVVSATAPRVQRSILQQAQRDWKARQLKKEHAAQVALAQAKANLPKADVKNAQVVSSFEGLEVHGNETPQLPWMKEPNVLYRGMGLDVNGNAIRNILDNGLLLKDVGKDNNHLASIYAGGAHGLVRESASMRFTNLADTPATALHYAQRNNTPGRVAVIVRVTGLEDYHELVQLSHDISADHIEEMIALVNINNTPTWCRVKIEEGQFLLTPYQ